MDTSKLERGVRYNTNTGQVLPPRGTNVPAPIDVSTINTPIQPLAVKQPELSSASTGVLASADALTTQAENFANTLVEKTKLEQDKTENQGILKSLYSKITNSKGKTELFDENYNRDLGAGTTVNAAQKELNDINAQIRSIQRAQKTEIDAIGKGGPVNPTQFNAANAAINRQYASQLADLSVIQQAKMDNYSAAREIADRAVAISLEKEGQQLDALKFFYQENKEQLNKKEAQQFELLIGERSRLLQEQATQKKAVSDIAIEAIRNGAPAELAQAAMKAGSQDEALGLVGKYVGLMDRQMQQSQLATDRLQRANIVSQIEDRKAAAIERANQLPGPVQTRVQGIAGQFDGEQAVKSYQVTAEAIDAFRSLGTSPTDDISRVYAFAKVMDPNSVVREGEYKTVQDYSAALLQRTGIKAKRVFDNSGFLTPEARSFMQTTLDNRLNSSKKAYDNIYNSYGQRINKVTGGDDGKEYITDYSAAFKASGDQYAELRTQVKSNEILIERNGQIGAIPVGEFNPSTDKKL